MENRSHYSRFACFIVRILFLLIVAIALPAIASAQSRIISLSGDLDFGQIPLRTSAQRTLTISNAGDSVLTIRDLRYPAEPAFVTIDWEGNFSGPIAPGDSQDVVITFTPLGNATPGATNLDFQGYLFVDSDANGGTNSIPMSGVGTWPPATRILSLSSNLDFGNVPMGDVRYLEFSLTNTGTMPLTVSNITFPSGFGSGFTPLTVDAGGTTNIYIWFNPMTVTNYGGVATITSDATEPTLVLVTFGGNFTNSLLGTSQFTVSGTGVYPSGNFIGVFLPATNATFDNSGYFTARCNDKGKLNATITLAGKRYPFSAQIPTSGAVSASIPRKHLPNLNVTLNTLFNGRWSGTVNDGTWNSDLTIESTVLLNKNARRLIPAGKYPLNLLGSTNDLTAPTTPGTCTLEIRNSEITRVKGILGDGTRYSKSTFLCNGIDLPLYAPLYRDRGAIIGWISFAYQLTSPGPRTNQPPPTVIPLPPVVLRPITNLPPRLDPPPGAIIIIRQAPPVYWLPPTNAPVTTLQPLTETATRPLGTMHWFKPAGIDPDYPDGFSFQTRVTGSVP